MLPKVAIVYLSFHCEPYLDDAVSALKKITYPKDRLEFIIVDNPHPIHGSSVRFIEDAVMALSGKEIPHVTILAQEKNTGFAGGNNAGIKWALDNDFQYVYFHNIDGFVAANFLEPLISAMQTDERVGAIQSLLMLYPETDLINSSGNSLNYLGVGYCNNFRVPKISLSLPALQETNYASGAAVLMRADLLKKFGLWDEDFFMYHEDVEYSLRLKIAGYKIVVSSESLFYHKYNFGRNSVKFYGIERNRLGVMLMFYKFPTLLLLLPIGIIFELGIVLFALQGGWLMTKLQTYGYWLQPASWRLWLKKRYRVQRLRAISDRQLLKNCVSRIIFNESTVQNPLLTYIGNPLMAVYWAVVKQIIFW